MPQTFIHKLFHGICKLGVASIAVSFVLTSLGPVLDHHFAERNPLHAHLYFGAAERRSPHSHPYETPHDHASHRHQKASSSSGSTTVYLSPSDGLAQVITLMPPVPIEQAPVRSERGNPERLYRILSDDLPQYASYVPLAKKPPRA